MSDVGAPSEADAPPARQLWLKDRVGSWPEQTRQRWLHNAGLDLSTAHECVDVPECKASDWGFAKLPSIDSLFASIENGHESPFMDRLLSSRTFHSPDCSEAMAELLHVTRVLEGLQGSALLPPKTAASREAVKELRNSLKSGIKSAWSHEALRRGIASAKSGEQETAIQTYDRALELDRRNVDAHVARGAAFANQRNFARAVADFETALETDPEHANAARYLAAVREQAAHLNISVASRPEPALATTTQASPSSHAAKGRISPSSRKAPRTDTGAILDDQQPQMPRAGPNASAKAEDPPSRSGSPDEQLDIQKALQIVSDHYGKRNATFPLQRRHSDGETSHRKHKRRKSRHQDDIGSYEEARSSKKKKKAKDKGRRRSTKD
ncbi:g10378 [Coccomyxa viridis]|uniref:G10378 protein n=1 Tax=Coccomyxa viridis TaxID=1274662 RepID=A0ABP1G9T3_9CHLO